MTLAVLFLAFYSLAMPHAMAQTTPSIGIVIGGNVYGGGNEGEVSGSTTVTMKAAEVRGSVFGGARMADVGGRAFVHIDGENTVGGEILLKRVYGGNDIAGTVGKNVNSSLTTTTAIPTQLTEVGKTEGKNDINDSWVAFVRTSKMPTEDYDHRIVVGTIFGGGNGDYNYFSPGDITGQDSIGQNIVATKYEVRDKSTGALIAEDTVPFTKPTLSKTYLELLGGCLAHVYGGGNNVTVTQNTTLCINNTSKGLAHLLNASDPTGEFKELTGILEKNTFQNDYSNLDYTFARIFGGNNKAEMSIMPVWNIQRGRIRDLYSGGNEGNMTSPYGLLMDIAPLGTVAEMEAGLYITNVYGGCRRADVNPKNSDGQTPSTIQLPIDNELYSSYKFPAGLSARTIVRGGHIINVYGGNDISGRVYGGDAVGIYSTVYGDVYGAGNGSYSYTDNPALGALDTYRDYYYDPAQIKEEVRQYDDPDFEYSSTDSAVQSVEALNLFRPNAEQISIRLAGSETNPTYVKGAVYLGGNSATLRRKQDLPAGTDPLVELKIGSYVIVDKMYLGNNGANMVTEEILHRYAGYQNTATGETLDTGTADTDFSNLNLLDANIFAKYMDGCAMSLKPRVVFDLIANNDQEEYTDYSSMFGSFYCGGNRGSMTWPGTNTIDFNRKVYIYDKFVGGCNNANIEATAYNAAYFGGMIGAPDEQGPTGMKEGNAADGKIKDCLVLNLRGLRLRPMRWVNNDDPLQGLTWNTVSEKDGSEVEAPALTGSKEIDRNNASDRDDFERRLKGGNIYGGCYVSGHMNGNVVINVLDSLVEADKVFDTAIKEIPNIYTNDKYTITKRNSGVILDEMAMDPLTSSLNIYGAGYGKDSEVWGSTTVNMKMGFVFQIYGGGEKGIIGQARENFAGTALAATQSTDYEFNGKHFFYDPRFSTYVNLNDTTGTTGSASSKVAELEYAYGGGFEGPVAGNTRVNLGNCRLYGSFGGACNADILGHTESYIGVGVTKEGRTITGFPYVIEHLYGGNDLGGRIFGSNDFTTRVGTTNGQDLTKVYKYDASSNPNPGVLNGSTYVEYTQGHAVNIYGGAYGDYDYTIDKYSQYCNTDGSPKEGFYMPRLGRAIVNFKPVSNTGNAVNLIYGGCEGRHYLNDRDVMQESSYVLIDIPQDIQAFKTMAVFGAGTNSGLGMAMPKDSTLANNGARLDDVSAIVDLVSGQIKNVYGGSFSEGVTRRTVINVPDGSTIAMKKQKDSAVEDSPNSGCIFGGAYGEDLRYPCDVLESHVNYSSNDAAVEGGIFGGNNNARRTLFTNVNINSTVWSDKTNQYQGYVYGGGFGEDTWAHYTNVNLNDGAKVYKVYGGGSAGRVLNEASLTAWAAERAAASEVFDLTLGGDYTGDGYTVNLDQNPLALWSELSTDIDAKIVIDQGNGKVKYNTNVHVNPGALVSNYAYGGGYGEKAVVSGSTYIALNGGRVLKDIYSAGESGPVMCQYSAAKDDFVACTNAYVKSGRVRNVYGGGWKGDVGHLGATHLLTMTSDEIPAMSNVIIGTLTGTSFSDGIPVVERNAYGGGEGGAIYGTAHISLHNGYVGYRYEGTDSTTFNAADYVEELDDWENKDPEKRKNGLLNSGNIFGGGYAANSYTDNSKVYMYKGVVRGSVYGGGEIGPIGRGTVKSVTGAPIVNGNANIFKAGKTNVYVIGGQVNRNVFGGGRGYDNWGGDGTELYKDQPEILAQMDLQSKGFVFGETDVHIYGGTIGTEETLEQGYGNVFGGGDIGFVYSGHGKRFGERGDALSTTDGLPVNGGGFYYKYYNDDGTNVGNFAAAKTNGMTMDCNVEVAPYCQVLDGQTLELPELQTDAEGNFVLDGTTGNPIQTGGTKTFNAGEFVPYEYLNLLRNKNADGANWAKLDMSGVVIRNAVFAGGNVSTGSDQIFVNTNTVYGNATAALRDVYHRDLITVGTEHIGGLYGDGNLTFVDGFRELHIANYGTDFYGMSEKISKEEYDSLSDRERAYFELQYLCIASCKDKNDKEYSAGATISYSEFRTLFEGTSFINEDGTPNEAYWKQQGVCTIYAGRLLNTLQRADFVGVYGSRLVLQGARDRVPEVADYTNYTVNRVGEVSLNKMNSQISSDTGNDASHGNYFGIYNIVNYLGNLTSDNLFTNTRTTSTTNTSLGVDGKSYYDWKNWKIKDRYRNNATSHNKVALASGVYLELKNEPTAGSTGVDWGYVTGVIELDLINVKQGLGGGYVYAKNEHGIPDPYHTEWSKVTLTPYNRFAQTFRRFTYKTDDASKIEMETSGNFVHNVKQIVDDCYPTHNKYLGADAVPAHYWYIKGSIYVYDQYISAYTGAATAYSEMVSIPLSIQAGAHGRLTLREVQPSLYAYYDKNGKKLGSDGADEKMEINGKHYVINEPITYWDWTMLTVDQQARFVQETYTVVEKCKIGGVEYPVGYTMLPSDYESMKSLEALAYDADTETYEADPDKDATFFLRPSNNVSHDTGYVLTFDMDNPMVWDDYYTKNSAYTDKVNTAEYADGKKQDGTSINVAEYVQGPTYHMVGSQPGVYGQKHYEINDVISNTIVDSYPYKSLTDAELLERGQAKFEPAWVTTQAINVDGATINPGVAIVESEYSTIWGTTIKENTNVVPAKLITSTLQLSNTSYLYAGDILSEVAIKEQIQAANPSWTSAEVNTYYSNNSSYIADAYYCTRAGDYGGKTYTPNMSYQVLDAWSSMSTADRQNFRFNYDAFDLLIDPTYGGGYGYKPQYDGYAPGSSKDDVEAGTAAAQYDNVTPLSPTVYSPTTAVNYTAVYGGTSPLTYHDASNQLVTIAVGDTLSNEEFEAIPNERHHYSTITVTSPGLYYVVREPFIRGDLPYTVGEVITKAQYDALDDAQQKPKVDKLYFPAEKAGNATTNPVLDGAGNPTTDDRGYDVVYTSKDYFYCRDTYTIGHNGEGRPVTTVGINSTSTLNTPTTYNVSDNVPLGTVIDNTNYLNLVNKTVDSDGQLFSIIGNVPVETSTLYVTRESDIYDLSKEKVITVIYLYEYEESDESGTNILPVSERHIVNIHLQFKSGVPQIGQLTKPNTVLPGSTVGLKVPEVTTGAFEVLSSGWEVFANKDDASKHKNGTPFVNNNTRVYWYQDDYQIAYYTKTYLGKTYSNYVPLSVGNYHDIADVMADKSNHMFIDHKDAQKYGRGPKIYIDNRNTTETNTHKSELDMLKDLFDLSLFPKYDEHGEVLDSIHGSEIGGHNRLDPEQIGATKNLDFILRDDVAPKYYTDWTPIGDATQDATTGKFTKCFEGTLHGDGHTISGLNNSLFQSLCGEIYNLGVKGTFTSAGIVETGTGYMENCWINTENTATAGVKPLFNNPARNATMEEGKYAGSLIQVVNSYYPTENGYSFTADAEHGLAIEKPLKSFHNGEVAYDLNGFYLNKRYYDHVSASGYNYKYFDTKYLNTENKPTLTDGHYPVTNTFDYEYVVNRYSNIDFTFAGGTVPSNDDERLVVDTVSQSTYYAPIWPDDYLFFGQRLTYGYVDGRPHQDNPSYITKSNGHVLTEANSNRVYRAPAYFRSKEMSVAHYNPQAVFADHKNGDADFPIHRYMTAIDFTGSNGDVAGGYKLSWQSNGHFFPPLLDNDGLTDLRNEGLTKNWLVYTPDAISGNAGAADTKTNHVVLDYLKEYEFESNVTNTTYKTVAVQDDEHQHTHGHAVVMIAPDVFSAPADRDHFLVDKQDFNAPIAYDIASGHRMWYQRRPDTYVDRNKGWEGISLPFSVELVTTQQKGEITHFYSGSQNSYNDTNTKLGHEYWLREFKEGGTASTTDANVFEANFTYPSAQPDWAVGTDKEYTNTFLWDYYYKDASAPRQDKNTDTYQQEYYKEAKTFKNYAYADAAKPYIIGFPGTTYYEFDLSGAWKAANSHNEIVQLGRQVITFASHQASTSQPLTINVSDDEIDLAITANTADGYAFTPNYLGKPMEDGSYQLSSDGSSYAKVSASGTPAVYPNAVPFRPYFVETGGAPVKDAGQILISSVNTTFGQQPELSDELNGELIVTGKQGRILVTSQLNEYATVRIVNAAGALYRTFAIAPGETVETRVPTGIYIVNKTKIAIK